MSEMLSCHDHGNCELCDLLETERAALEAKLEAMERIKTAAVAVGAYFRYGPLLDALAATQEEE